MRVDRRQLSLARQQPIAPHFYKTAVQGFGTLAA
jgi:hypothetical protein